MSHNNNHNNHNAHPLPHQTLNLACLEQQREELQARLACEEAQIEAAMRAEQARMEEEKREAEERQRAEQLRREEAERKRCAEEVQKQQEAVVVEDNKEDNDDEPEAGLSAPKNRKVQDTAVSDGPPFPDQTNGATQEVRQLTKWNTPSCSQCTTGSAVCYGKSCSPSCWRCYKRKINCSLVVQKRKKEEKGKGRVVEDEEEPEGLQNILERLMDTMVGIGYAMEVWMQREEEREKKKEKEKEEEKARRSKGKREQGVQKDGEEMEDEDEDEDEEGGGEGEGKE